MEIIRILAVMGITLLGLEMATDPTDSLFTTEVYASTNQIGTANITIDIADWESGVETLYIFKWDRHVCSLEF